MALNISIDIQTNGNAAFADDPAGEVARILRQLADRLDSHELPDGNSLVRDINGNKCGNFSVIEE